MRKIENGATAPLLSALMLCLSSTCVAGDFHWKPAFRYRAQSVNDQYRGDAFASTLKLRLSAGYQVGDAWSFEAAVDHVLAFDDGHYNNIVVHRDSSPIPDPPGTEIAELSVRYRPGDRWTLWGGRLPLSQDDERHVGTQEFWQKRQTFDGIQLSYDDSLNFSVSYTYLTRVNRFFGSDAKSRLSPDDLWFDNNPVRSPTELGVHDHNSHLFHGKYNLSNSASVSGYLYLLDNRSMTVSSSNTLGLRYQMSAKPDLLKYELTLEGAIQQEAADNPIDYQTTYALVEGKVRYKSHQWGIRYEHLGSDGNRRFDTSLGSNHKFLGWADALSNYTATIGINDTALRYRGRHGKLRWELNYHLFYDKAFDNRIGDEIDAELAYRFNRQWETKLIIADYRDKNGLATGLGRGDLTSLYFMLSYNL